jgi:hypothetical protein
MRDLAARNLRRSHLLNIPAAQPILDHLDKNGVTLDRLSHKQLTSGATGDVMKRGSLEEHTPLWFYILKEAEVLADGQHLGPLGSYLIAETLVGLVVHGQGTYWQQAGSDDGRWHPRDGVQPGGRTVDSFAELMRAALLLA